MIGCAALVLFNVNDPQPKPAVGTRRSIGHKRLEADLSCDRHVGQVWEFLRLSQGLYRALHEVDEL